MKLSPVQTFYDELKGTATVRGAENATEAWLCADNALCCMVTDDDDFVPVIVNGNKVTEPNSDGEFIFEVKKIPSTPGNANQ